MMVASCSGHCAMHADRTSSARPSGRRLLSVLATAFALSVAGSPAVAAEAPPPVPPAAEAAHQDLRGNSGSERAESEKHLDEAIFTEISALTVPEIGVALPADQEH